MKKIRAAESDHIYKNAKKNRLLSWQTEGGYGACWKTFITMSQKYALEGTRVYVELDKKEDEAVFSIKNISSKPLNIPSDELTERFYPGRCVKNNRGKRTGSVDREKNLYHIDGWNFRYYFRW